MPTGPLDFIPLWLLFILTLAIVIVPVEIGYRLGRAVYRRPAHEDTRSVDILVPAAMALVAFILAFTYGWAQSRYDDRRMAQAESTNALGIAFRRAAFAPEPYRSEIRRLLLTEVDVRLRRVPNAMQLVGLIHDTLWHEVALAAPHIAQSDIAALVVESVNDVITATQRRFANLYWGRVPMAIWLVLFSLSAISTGLLGYDIGIAGSQRSLAAIPLALAFAIVIVLIADIDRPFEGLLAVDYDSLERLKVNLIRQSTFP